MLLATHVPADTGRIGDGVKVSMSEGTRPHADAALLERALDKAIVSGDTVLRELIEREIAPPRRMGLPARLPPPRHAAPARRRSAAPFPPPPPARGRGRRGLAPACPPHAALAAAARLIPSRQPPTAMPRGGSAARPPRNRSRSRPGSASADGSRSEESMAFLRPPGHARSN